MAYLFFCSLLYLSHGLIQPHSAKQRKYVINRRIQFTLVNSIDVQNHELSLPEINLLEAVGGGNAAIYGEITESGFRSLMTSCRLSPDDSFVDLGSGSGSVVLQAASEFRVFHACGVELASSRHQRALIALTSSDLRVRSCTTFIEGDVGATSTAGVLSKVSTVVWISNLLFSDGLMSRVVSLVEDAPTVRLVAVLKPIVGGLRGFIQDKYPVFCQMSWTKPSDGVNPPELGHPCIIYRREAYMRST